MISPDFYDTYLLVLKIVAIVIACVMPFVAVISAFENVDTIVLSEVLAEAFLQMIVLTLQGVFQAFAWVTIIFAVIERTGVSVKDLPVPIKEWKVDDLKDVNIDNKKKIYIADPIMNIIFSIAFLAVMYYSETLLGWYQLKDNFGENKFSVTPLFNNEIISKYLPYMAVLTAFIVIISILKLIYRQWNLQLAFFNLTYNLLSTVFVFVFFTNKSLVSNEFIALLSSKTEFSINQVTGSIDKFGLGIAILVTICVAVDTVEGFLKARK